MTARLLFALLIHVETMGHKTQWQYTYNLSQVLKGKHSYLLYLLAEIIFLKTQIYHKVFGKTEETLQKQKYSVWVLHGWVWSTFNTGLSGSGFTTLKIKLEFVIFLSMII